MIFSSLMTAVGLQRYESNKWCLVIDSSKRSFKFLLLHNGNKLAIAHSTKVKEKYSTIELVMYYDKVRSSETLVGSVSILMLTFRNIL